jgi:hypothetical protein
MPDSVGSAAQTRLIAEQVAEAVIMKYESEHPRQREAEIHPTIKWLVGAIAACGLAALVGGGSWLVSSVSEMQLTLARMDERIANGSVKDARFDELDRRVTKLEAHK